MNTIVYCRVSSKDQLNGTSLETQEAACREYAARKGMTIVRVFVEEGESAKYAERPQLLELLRFCKDRSRRIDVLLVWKVDRFARNIEDHYAVKATLRNAGVRIASVTEALDDDPTGKLMEAVLAGFSEFDNDLRTERCVGGMKKRLSDGIYPWRPPPGYLSPNTSRKTEPDHADPVSFPLLQRAWQLALSGAYSRIELIRLLRSWRARGRDGILISPQAIDRMFRNPYYAGVLRDPWNGAEYAGRHPAMVTPDEYAKVQRLLRGGRTSYVRHKIRHDFEVRGLVRCSSCSACMTGTWSQGRTKKYAYYLCKQKGCAERDRNVPAAIIHEEFLDMLARASTPEAVLNAVVLNVDEKLQAEATAQLRQRGSRQRECRDLQDQLHRLIDMHTTKLISTGEFIVQRDKTRRRISLVNSLEDDRSLDPLAESEVQHLKAAFLDLTAHWRALTPIQKQGFGRLFVPKGYVHLQSRTAHLGRLFRLSEPNSIDNYRMVDLAIEHPNTIIAEFRQFLAIAGTPKPAETDAA